MVILIIKTPCVVISSQKITSGYLDPFQSPSINKFWLCSAKFGHFEVEHGPRLWPFDLLEHRMETLREEDCKKIGLFWHQQQFAPLFGV